MVYGGVGVGWNGLCVIRCFCVGLGGLCEDRTR